MTKRRYQRFFDYLLETKRVQNLLVVFITLSLILVTCFTVVQSRTQATIELREESEQKLGQFVNRFTNELNKHAVLPQLLAEDERIHRLLNQPDNSNIISQANRYLEYVNQIDGAADIYVMNRQGVTLASSNWQSDRSFVGSNYNFRPYFTKALTGVLGTYTALGSVSNLRGYYFAYPVRSDGDVIGVVTVKISPKELETAWQGGSDKLLVTDSNGIIFMSNDRRLLFKTLETIPDELRERILKSRQYGKKPLSALPLSRNKLDGGDTTLVRVEPTKRPIMDVGKSYLLLTSAIPSFDLNGHILADSSVIYQQILFDLLINNGVVVIIFLITTFLLQRYLITLQKIQYQKQIETTLVEANHTLEEKVKARTNKLAVRNIQLTKSIQKHKAAERKIKETTDQLIHSAKMATIGQMSTGISHELSQPLTAIKNYLHTSKRLLMLEKYDGLNQRLSDILSLVDRMTNLTRELRVFSKKKAYNTKPIVLLDSVKAAIKLVDYAHKKSINFEYQIDAPEVVVNIDAVRFEQVIINLLKNAIDASSESDNPKITIVIKTCDETVELSIRDYGSGIPEELLDCLFDPFVTNKKTGSGLGLGLSISREIIHAHEGTIHAMNCEEGGALFSIRLPH